MNTQILTTLVAATIAATALSQAETFTWIGGMSNVWSDPTNWDVNGVPEETDNGVVAGASSDHVIAITNGVNMPTDGVPPYANGQFTPNRTPRFDIRAGASLTINQSITGALGGPTQGGDIVTVGAGASLTWVSTLDYRLMRHPDGVQNYDINGGAFTLEAPAANGRLDWGNSSGRLVHFDLDGGTFSYTGFRMFGTRNANVTFDTPSTVTLANGSTFDTPAYFHGNMVDNVVGNSTLTFDIQDASSSMTVKFGGVFPDIAAVEAAEGINWICSTLGNENLLSTDNLDGTFTVGLAPSATDAFRITEIVLEAENQIRLTWTSKAETTYSIYWSTDLTSFPSDVNDSIPSGGTATSLTFTDPTVTAENPQGDPRVFFRIEEN